MFPFSVFFVSIHLWVSYFSVFSVSIRLVASCSYSSQFTWPQISSISSSENQPIFNIILVWSANPLKRAPAEHDIQTCCLGPKTIKIWICHFSWVVYCCYTRPRGCLLYVFLSKLWPGAFTRKRTLKWATQKF